MVLKHLKPIAFIAIVLAYSVSAFAGSYYGDGRYIDADLGARYESNLSRSNDGADIEEDMVTALSAGAGYLKTLNNNSQLLISAYLAHEHFAEFKDLNNIAVNASIVYTLQPKAGYTEPWYEISMNVAALKFNKSNIRDSVIFTGKASIGKRFSDRIVGKINYKYEQRDSDSLVFDTKKHDASLNLIYAYSPRTSFFGTYNFSIGDVVSTATPNPTILAASERVAPDDVFAAGFGPGCVNRRCAYRLDAIGHHFETGLEIALTQSLSLDISSQYFIVDGKGLEAYKGWVYRAGMYFQY